MLLIVLDHAAGTPRRAAFELVSAGRSLADALGVPLAGLVLGDAPDVDAAAAALAGFVPHALPRRRSRARGGGHEARTRAVADVARAAGARAILLTANRSGQAVAPRVALRLGGALLEDVTEVRVEDGAARRRAPDVPLAGGRDRAGGGRAGRRQRQAGRVPGRGSRRRGREPSSR